MVAFMPPTHTMFLFPPVPSHAPAQYVLPDTVPLLPRYLWLAGTRKGKTLVSTAAVTSATRCAASTATAATMAAYA